MRQLPLFFGFGMLLLLSACVSTPELPDDKICPQIQRNIFLCLLAPAKLPQGTAQHLVNLRFANNSQADKSRTFIGLLTINRTELRLRGLSPMGLTLFDLQFNGSAIKLDAPDSALPKPALLLALLQFMLAEPTMLKKTLPDNLRLEIQPTKKGLRRILRAGDKTIMTITVQGRQPLVADYTVTIPASAMTLQLQNIE